MPHQIAFLSTAHMHARDFIKRLSSDDLDARVHTVWDDVPERGRRYAESCGAIYADDLETVLADDAIDGFVICEANTRHRALLEKTLPRGKPVCCEKPITTTADDARRVAALLAEYDTPLCSGYFYPFEAKHRAVKRALDAGVFGELTHAFFRNSHHAAYGRWFDDPDLAFFIDPELAGGGALMDMGAHAVHLLRHLCGPATEVWATTANVSGIYPAVDDYGTMQITFANGVLGRAEAAWVHHGGPKGLELWGTEGSLIFVDGQPAVARAKQDPELLPEADGRPARMDRLVAILDRRLDPDELREDLAACLDEVLIMDAAYASAISGRSKPVPTL